MEPSADLIRTIDDIFVQSYSLYLRAAHTISFYLFQVNSATAKKRRQHRPVKIVPSHFVEESEMPIYPSFPKTCQYLFAPTNLATSSISEVSYLRFDYFHKRVYCPMDYEPLCRSSSLSDCLRGPELLLNDHYLRLLFQLVTEQLPSSDWFKALGVMKKTLDKSLLPLIREFNSLIAWRLEEPVPQQGKAAEFIEAYCKKCHMYICPGHTYKTDIVYEADPSSQSDEPPLADLDRFQWKNAWYRVETSLLETGLWALTYKCTHENTATLSDSHKDLVKRLHQLHMSNPCFLGLFLNVSCSAVAQYLKKLPPQPRPPKVAPVREPTVNKPSMVVTNVVSLRCSCKSICWSDCACTRGLAHADSLRTSTFIRSGCDKYCECPPSCKVRFLGCTCRFNCIEKECECLVNKRECDPDLCRTCCSFLALRSGEPRLCRNVATQRGRRPRLALGPSLQPGAGLGLFALEALQPGVRVIDYTGELVNFQETEVRGPVYDYHQHSYIFSFNSDTYWSVDSNFVGNRMRYVNHKSHGEENCRIEVWNIRGNTCIMLVTARKIKPGEELSFNYGYRLEEVHFQWYHEYEAQFDTMSKRISS